MNYLDMIDPTDPMSVLVAADWLEESGRTTEAKALRTLAPPLEGHSNSYGYSDGYIYGDGHGYGYGYGDHYGNGNGYRYSNGYGNGHDYGDGQVYGGGYGYVASYRDGYGNGYGGGINNKKIVDYLSHLKVFLKSAQPICPGRIHELP